MITPLHGPSVRSWRVAHNITQAQLSEMCGIAASNISRFERGETEISDITACALRNAMEAFTMISSSKVRVRSQRTASIRLVREAADAE